MPKQQFMSEQKKTEEQLRHDMRRKFNFSEKTDTKRIDSAVEMEKDRFKAVEKKLELKKKLKSDKPVGKKDPAGTNHSLKDIRALGKVADEDLDKVITFAEKFHDGSAHEALKDKDLQAIIKNRKEERATAKATNTGSGKRGSSKVSSEKLLSDSEKGILPESEKDMKRLAYARLKAKA